MAKKESDRQRWPGGYIRAGVFVIERRIRGVKFHVSTHCTSLRGAMKQLERFEANPADYRPEGPERGSALVMTEQLIDDFHAWHLDGVTRTWALNVRSLLADWANHFAGADLRALDLIKDVKPHLAGATQRHHRVKALKLFFGWLRGERGLVTRAQDVTLDLPVPVIPPALRTRAKAVPWEHVVAVAAHLPPHVRDVLELLAATGWHVAEVRRFAEPETGTIRERTPADPPNVIVVLGTVHKSGRRHFTALLHAQHVAVAKRIRERKHVIADGRLGKHMRRAVKLANAQRRAIDPGAPPIEPFQLGAMRHSVATWLSQAGVPIDDTAKYLGHEGSATTKRHYVDGQVAAIVLPVRALRVVG